jgi:Tfp pilus assembly protein PilN
VIRTNLATRPFYNERAVHLWLAVAAGVLALTTACNVSRVLTYARSDTRLQVQAGRDEDRARELRANAAKLRTTVDNKQVERATGEAREANELIDRRTFSWTELLNRFETTLPADVRITSVRPRISRDRQIEINVTVLARGVNDVHQFMENLEETQAFADILSRSERINEEGQLEAGLEMRYAPTAAPGADGQTAQSGTEARAR